MRRKDKSLAMIKANILFEQRNLKSKGLIKEESEDTNDIEKGKKLAHDENSLKGGSLKDFGFPPGHTKMYNFLNDGWMAWSDENGNVCFRKLAKGGGENVILDYFNSEGFKHSNQFTPDVPSNMQKSQPDYRRK